MIFTLLENKMFIVKQKFKPRKEVNDHVYVYVFSLCVCVLHKNTVSKRNT